MPLPHGPTSDINLWEVDGQMPPKEGLSYTLYYWARKLQVHPWVYGGKDDGGEP